MYFDKFVFFKIVKNAFSVQLFFVFCMCFAKTPVQLFLSYAKVMVRKNHEFCKKHLLLKIQNNKNVNTTYTATYMSI